MAKTVDTWETCFQKLQKVNLVVVRKFSLEVKQTLKETLDELWYQQPRKIVSSVASPDTYIRTYDLLESIVVTEVSRNGKYGAKATVYFDASKLTHQRPSNSRWGQHLSMDNTPIGNILAYWIDQGNGDSPYFHYDGVNYVQATLEQINAISYRAQKKLQSMGYNIEIKY